MPVMSGNLCIEHYHIAHSCNGHLVYRFKVESTIAGYIGAHLPGEKVKPEKQNMSTYTMSLWTLNRYVCIYKEALCMLLCFQEYL